MPQMSRKHSGGYAPNMSPPARPRFVERVSYLSSDTMMSDELWPEDEKADVKRRRDEQPMSPFVVIRERRFGTVELTPVYVVFFYLVWQILTRSDENEILSHLPPTSPLRGQQGHAVEHSASQQQPYQFPYALPHIPSPIRDTEAAAASSSTWRTVLQSILYPFYFLVTLAVIPLPFLNQALTLIMSIIGTILYPLTSTTRLLSRTFIVAPLQVVQGIFQALYPVYVFVGGVLGLGCFLGMSAGWIGQYSLDLLLTRKSPKRKTRRHKTKKHHSHSHSSTSSPDSVDASAAVERSLAAAGNPRQPRSPDIRTFHGRYVPVADIYDERDFELAGSAVNRAGGRSSAREPVVVGIRRRGMRSDA